MMRDVDGQLRRESVRARALLETCKVVLKTLQGQPGGCEHQPPCHWQVSHEAMLELRNRLALAIELAEGGLRAPKPDEGVREAYRLLDNWVHATRSQQVDADTGVVRAWGILAAVVDPANHCFVCGYPLEQGRCYSCGGPHQSAIGPGLIGDPAAPGDMP